MKKYIVLLFSGLSFFTGKAQQKEGKVIYERIMQLQMRVQDIGQEIEQMIPSTRTDKFELVFGNNKSLWKMKEDETPQDDQVSGNGIQIRMIIENISKFGFKTIYWKN